MNVRDRIASLSTSFEEHDAHLRTTDPLRFEGYGASDADACVWGWAEIGAHRCALVVFDFSFMGGSMGMVVGERVARAFDAATAERTPVVCVTASGGARMQEGMWSLVQMAKTTEARRRHRAAGLLQVTLVTSPTTGGVYASFGSLADVVFAEADATVGFAGPRVVRQLTGQEPPPDVHTASFALEHGSVDAVVTPDGAREAISQVLRCAKAEEGTRAGHAPDPLPEPDPATTLGAWERLELVRSEARRKAGEVLRTWLPDAFELRGDRVGGPDDGNVVVRIGPLADGRNIVGVAQHAAGDGRIRPHGFRKAIRAADLAGRLGLPLVTLIDTRGADPLPESEGAGIAGAIATTFEAVLGCPSPTVAVLLGEGGSGGALAMAVTDRVVASANAVFSVIAPEGAAAILYRDVSRAPELAERLRIGVDDLVALGSVDVVVPETVDRVGNVLVDEALVASTVATELDRLAGTPEGERLAARHERWRSIGLPRG